MKLALKGIVIGMAVVVAMPGYLQAAASTVPIPVAPKIAVSGEAPSPCLKRHRPLQSAAHATRKGTSRKGKTASDNVANDLNAQELSRSGGPAPTQPGPAQGPGPRR